jgi:hypothetical protein
MLKAYIPAVRRSLAPNESRRRAAWIPTWRSRKMASEAMASEETPAPSATQAAIQPRQPIIRSSLERFVYATNRSEEGVTGHAGLLLAIEAFHALGLKHVCDRELRLKQRDRGPTEAEWVE